MRSNLGKKLIYQCFINRNFTFETMYLTKTYVLLDFEGNLGCCAPCLSAAGLVLLQAGAWVSVFAQKAASPADSPCRRSGCCHGHGHVDCQLWHGQWVQPRRFNVLLPRPWQHYKFEQPAIVYILFCTPRLSCWSNTFIFSVL